MRLFNTGEGWYVDNVIRFRRWAPQTSIAVTRPGQREAFPPSGRGLIDRITLTLQVAS